MKFKTIEWKGDCIRLLDQRRLPDEVRYLECRNTAAVERAIRSMAVRGAPAIGVVAAMGIALAAKAKKASRPHVFRKYLEKACDRMKQTRPTAVNLFWAVDRMKRIIDGCIAITVREIQASLEREALRIYEEDVETNRKIGRVGKHLIREGTGILTHCNAGALATAGWGTALGILYAARSEGKRFRVFVDETRPLLQGARLTAWELIQKRVPTIVVTDNMAAWLMKQGEIDLILVGADRIARNGDTANKIGTYGLAVLANHHGIPFYVAAPTSTLDLSLSSGKKIPIEERSADEVTHFRGRRISPRNVKVRNPAFDVTPHSLIKGFITEKGMVRKPFERNLKKIAASRS